MIFVLESTATFFQQIKEQPDDTDGLSYNGLLLGDRQDQDLVYTSKVILSASRSVHQNFDPKLLF